MIKVLYNEVQRKIVIFCLDWRNKNMSNESKKDFYAMMKNNKNMPKICLKIIALLDIK